MQRKIETPKWVPGRTIYEVNIRQYTPEGTFKAFEDHLPRLKELGIGILWFMPVQPIGEKNRKGSLGSYYSISNYTAINPEFGTLEDFKRLVKKAQQLGMKVLIDWVANHTAWDHHWTKDHPEFYTKDVQGDFKAPVPEWEDVIHLDYGNPDLWDSMIDAMKYWLSETGIDGFRCDMAHLVPTLFWNRARRDLDRVKPVFLLAESQNHDLLEYAFDSIYNWKLLHAFNELAAGSMRADELLDLAMNEISFLPEGSLLLNFTSNHDENSWQGSAIERLHYFLEPITVLTFLLRGIPLIYSGQEAGNYRKLKFFDKDVIEWKEDKIFSMYQKLVALNHEELISDGMIIPIENDSNGKVLSFEISQGDHRIVTFLNFSGESQKFYIQCKDFDGHWENMMKNEPEKINCKEFITLEPYQYTVLKKQ